MDGYEPTVGLTFLTDISHGVGLYLELSLKIYIQTMRAVARFKLVKRERSNRRTPIYNCVFNNIFRFWSKRAISDIKFMAL